MMGRTRYRRAAVLLGVCVLAIGAAQCGGAPAATRTPATSSLAAAAVSYPKVIQPIFNQNCVGCHGRSGGLGLANYEQVMAGGNSGPAVVPGDPQGSLLVLRITGAVQPRMPLGGPPLSAADIQAIENWIAEQAPNN
jgi:mono/diheme cytochrome c family protein